MPGHGWISVPKGLTVSVCHYRDSKRQWRKHTMRETVDAKVWNDDPSGAMVLYCRKWLILTRKKHLTKTSERN